MCPTVRSPPAHTFGMEATATGKATRRRHRIPHPCEVVSWQIPFPIVLPLPLPLSLPRPHSVSQYRSNISNTNSNSSVGTAATSATCHIWLSARTRLQDSCGGRRTRGGCGSSSATTRTFYSSNDCGSSSSNSN